MGKLVFDLVKGKHKFVLTFSSFLASNKPKPPWRRLKKCLLILQGWEFAHSLIAHLLKSLRTNEQMWAIRSGRSGQMSDCERIAQVAHEKWANVSDSLRSLRTNEWMSKSLGILSKSLMFLFSSQKMSNPLKKIPKNRFFVRFYSFF